MASEVETESSHQMSNGTERLSRREAFLQEKQAIDDVVVEYELTPDIRTGLYTICVRKPSDAFTTQEAQETFEKFGTIGKMNVTKRFIFVCYVEKEAAETAMETLKDQFGIFVPEPRNSDQQRQRQRPQQQQPQQQQQGPQTSRVDDLMSRVKISNPQTPNSTVNWQTHIRTNPCIYIGNLAQDITKEDVEMLVKPYRYNELMFYVRGLKRFAFAYFANTNNAKMAQQNLSGKDINGRPLIVNIVRDKSRARIIEGGESRHAPGNMQNGTYGGHSHQRGSSPGPVTQGNVMVPMAQLQGATDLLFRIDGLLGEVLDDCYFCQRVAGLVGELQHCMRDIQEGASQRALAGSRGRGLPAGGDFQGYHRRGQSPGPGHTAGRGMGRGRGMGY